MYGGVALAALSTIPLRRPSRRILRENSLSGSMPSQLGRLTALKLL